MALIHKTARDNGPDGALVILEDAEIARFPFEPGERERDWREATPAEYAEYLAYWEAAEDSYTEDDTCHCGHPECGAC